MKDSPAESERKDTPAESDIKLSGDIAPEPDQPEPTPTTIPSSRPKASEPIAIPKSRSTETIVVPMIDNTQDELSSNEMIVDATDDLWSLKFYLEELDRKPLSSSGGTDLMGLDKPQRQLESKRVLNPYHVRKPALDAESIEQEKKKEDTDSPRRATFLATRKTTMSSLVATAHDIVKDIIVKVKKEWERPAELLPVAIDVPRLFRNVEIITVDGEAIVFPKSQEPVEQTSSRGYDSNSSIDLYPSDNNSSAPLSHKTTLRNFLETLAIELGDTKTTLPVLIQHWKTEFDNQVTVGNEPVSADVSVFFRLFIKQYLNESSSKTLRALKLINQSIISGPFVALKDFMLANNCPFIDVSGTWKISVQISLSSVTVIHYKMARSFEQNHESKESFRFQWELRMKFDKDITELQEISMSFPLLKFSNNCSRDRRKLVTSLIKSISDQFEFASKSVNSTGIDSLRKKEKIMVTSASSPTKTDDDDSDKPKSVYSVDSEMPASPVKALGTTLSTSSLASSTSPSLRPRLLSRAPSSSDLRRGTLGDRKFVDEMLGRTVQPLYWQWGVSTSNFSARKKDRMLVISNYRVFLIRKSKIQGKKKVVFDAHLFTMISVESPSLAEVVIGFSDDVWIKFESELAGDVIPHVLIPAYNKITVNFPGDFTLKTKFEPADRVLIKPQPQLSPAKAFSATYRAYCDLCKLVPSKNFLIFSENRILAGIKELKFDECPGFDMSEESSFDLAPVFMTLKFNKFFTKLTAVNTRRPDLIGKLAICMEANTTVTELHFVNIGAEEGYTELAQALKKNARNLVTKMNFSNNPIKDKSLLALHEAIQTMKHLSKLEMSNVGLSSTGAILICKGLGLNAFTPDYLLELDLSRNDLGVYGSSSLGNFLSSRPKPKKFISVKHSKDAVNLKKMKVSDCNLDFSNFFPSLTTSLYSVAIQHLDVSGNKFDKHSFKFLSEFVSECMSLKFLGVSRCDLQASQLTLVLMAVEANEIIEKVGIDFSENSWEVPVPEIEKLADVIASSKKVSQLTFSKSKIKTKVAVAIMKAVMDPRCQLDNLDLSFNKMNPKPLLTETLTQFFKTSRVKSFNFAGNKLGKDLTTALAEVSNSKLEFLEISGNRLENSGAIAVAEALRTNTTLKTLVWDHNKIGLEGWMAINNTLKANHTLQTLPFPNNDIRKSIAKGAPVEKITETMYNLQVSLAENYPKLTSVKTVGIAIDPNPLYRESMEDQDIFIDKFGGKTTDFFAGVFDGHGGAKAAEIVQDKLPGLVLKHLTLTSNTSDAFKNAFVELDEYLATKNVSGGSTAVCAFGHTNVETKERTVYCANVGDARAVISMNGKATRLSFDHKVSDPLELERLHNEKAIVINHRIGGSLAISRAFGDFDLKKYGVSVIPYFSTTTLPASVPVVVPVKVNIADSGNSSQNSSSTSLSKSSSFSSTFLILACDGVWDVLSDQEAVDLIQLVEDSQKAAEKLVQRAIELGSRDNISAIVMRL